MGVQYYFQQYFSYTLLCKTVYWWKKPKQQEKNQQTCQIPCFNAICLAMGDLKNHITDHVRVILRGCSLNANILKTTYNVHCCLSTNVGAI